MKKITTILLLIICLSGSQMAFSQNDSAIYGVVRSDLTGLLSLAKINVTNGKVTVISQTAFPSSYYLNSIATIDTKANRYYLFTNNQLTGIDIATGAIANQTALSITNPNYPEMMQYNPFDSTFYAMRYAGSLYLVKINTSTGLVTDITTSPLQVSYYLNSLAAIDPFKRRYYIQAPNPNTLYGFDLNTGNVVLTKTLDPSVYGFQLMRFNPHDSTLYGIASSTVTGGQHLAKLDPLTGTVTISNTSFNIPLFLGAIATIDPIKKIYYLQVNNQLKGYDLVSGNLVINTLLTFPFPGRLDLMVYCLECQNETPYGEVPVISVTGKTESCFQEDIILNTSTASVPAVTYSWSSNPNTVSFTPNSSAATVQIGFPVAGTYTISCTATNYLGSNTNTKHIFVSECTSIEEQASAFLENIHLAPNPSTGIFQLTLPAAGLSVSSICIYDALGRNIKTLLPEPNSREMSIDLSEADRGIYFMSISSGKNTITKKIMIN